MTKQEIKDMALKLGAHSCGFAPVRIYDELIPIIEKNPHTPFVRKNIEPRINPYWHLKNAKSIIVCLFPYREGEIKDVAKFAKGGDYHDFVKPILRELCTFLGKNCKCKVFVDSGGLLEKHLAYLAGLGFLGLNHLLYADGIGSRFYIGYIICDTYFEPDEASDKTCLRCEKCIKACPSSALKRDMSFDVLRCISYLTQKKEPLSDNEKEILKKSKYSLGCDVCSDVCPLNVEL